MILYGFKRNYNTAEDGRTKYDGWRSKGRNSLNRRWQKLLHRAERRGTRQSLRRTL